MMEKKTKGYLFTIHWPFVFSFLSITITINYYYCTVTQSMPRIKGVLEKSDTKIVRLSSRGFLVTKVISLGFSEGLLLSFALSSSVSLCNVLVIG